MVYPSAPQCLNGSQFIINQTSNESYCVCSSCYHGVRCEDAIERNFQVRFDHQHHLLIIYSIMLCISLINNLLSLAVFCGSKRIRRTNVGIYLIICSIISIVGSIILVAGQALYYYKAHPIFNKIDWSGTFLCYLEKSGYHVTQYLCLCLSALVAVERGLIICFSFRMNATRWRSLVTLIPMLCIVIVTSVIWLVNRCGPSTSNGSTAKYLSRLLYVASIIVASTYLVVTLLVVVNFTLRIYHYGNNQESKIKIFFKLVKKHFFLLIPPILSILLAVPYATWQPAKGTQKAYFQCGITAREYTLKLIVQTMRSYPIALTWLIYVYSSRIFMTEFYERVWIGRMLTRCFRD